MPKLPYRINHVFDDACLTLKQCEFIAPHHNLGIKQVFRPELFRDISNFLPKFDARIVFDVGANVGSTVSEFLKQFPHSTVHAFEPVEATYESLTKRFGQNPRVTCYQKALGSYSGTALVTARATATGNRIVTERNEVPVDVVEIVTGDEILEQIGSPRISYLKIDTEGYDLETLKGFSHSLAARKIDIYQVEVGLSLHNQKHIPLQEIAALGDAWGYRLFKIYNQALEKNMPLARRADAVFISERTALENQGRRKRSLLRRLAHYSAR